MAYANPNGICYRGDDRSGRVETACIKCSGWGGGHGTDCSQAAPPAVAQSLYTLYTQSVILDGLNVLALVLNVVGCDIRP